MARGDGGHRPEGKTSPRAQLRITDVDGHRITAFATNTRSGGPGTQLPDLELRHRGRARCEDRIRCAKDTGLANLPLHDFAQNQIWCAVVALACEITAWMQMLALHGHPARDGNPNGCACGYSRRPASWPPAPGPGSLHLGGHQPWISLTLQALQRLKTCTTTPSPSG